MTDTRRYWLAHVRGADYKRLREKGFEVLYPVVDDYVFLEVLPENEKFLKKQSELMIHFLRAKGGYKTISRKELEAMKGSKKLSVEPGQKIKAVAGIGQGLEGVVISKNGTRLNVELKGYERVFPLEVDEQEVVAIEIADFVSIEPKEDT